MTFRVRLSAKQVATLNREIHNQGTCGKVHTVQQEYKSAYADEVAIGKQVQKTVKSATTTIPAPTTTTTAVPALTQQQQSAVETAKQYLSTQAFSQQGLIDQLDSPDGGGYSVNDATVAVDSLTVNWNAEAVQAAKEYLADSALLMQRPDPTTGLAGWWRVHSRSGYVWSAAGRRLLVKLMKPNSEARPSDTEV